MVRTYQNMWNAVKVVFKGKFITLNVCIRKEGKSQINDRSQCFEVEFINLQVLTFPNTFDKSLGRQIRLIFSKNVSYMV